jgi:carbonic anhydrase
MAATAVHDGAARAAAVTPVPGQAKTQTQTQAQAQAPTDTPHAATALPAHWAYDGRGGPQAWGRLQPEFGLCASGRRQSPIDIRDGLPLDLDPVPFDYHPGSFAVVDNGHTVQVNVAPGNFIELMGRRYELQQFHFHRPSEERIDGRQFEMDVHLVHKDAEGRLAVVAVLLERGAAQPLLQTVWNHLPLERNEPLAARVHIDPQQLLPADRRYYTYMGSLTTPPCSEGVLWVVMQRPVSVSAAQIDVFARLYPMNARPIQRAAGRLIKQSN